MSSAFDQSSYQVRFEWGADGLRRLAPADVVVVVDVLSFSSVMTESLAQGSAATPADVSAWAPDAATVIAAAEHAGATVLLGCLRNAGAVARAVLMLQERRQQRTSVAVIAVGERTDAGGERFAVEDQLGAGTVIAALSDLGADHTSPEAAAACESARGLRRALRHLLTASGSAKALATAPIELPAGLVPVTAAAAAEVDTTEVVPHLRDGGFAAFS